MQERQLKSNGKKHKIVYIFILVLLLLLGTKKNYYCLNYFRPLGIRRDISFEELRSKIGEPNSIEYINREFRVIYDDFVYVTCHLEHYYSRLEITGKNIKFGFREIGIGSSKEKVKKAYKNVPQITDLPDCMLGYIDGITFFRHEKPWIVYKFDANEEVDQIKIYFGP